MGTAFEITADDVCNVLGRMRRPSDCPRSAEELFADLTPEHHAAIEKAALHGLDIDTQTEYAYQELESILSEILRSYDRKTGKER